MHVAIIDYEMGNLFSVRRACEHVGLEATITQDADAVRHAGGVILPGVGAFGDAMRTLRRLGMVEALQEVVAAGTPLFGICLGMQLLMSESEEFGAHRGLDFVPGTVARLSPTGDPPARVPHVGWNDLHRAAGRDAGTPLEDVPPEARMYFVHSYAVQPQDEACIVTTTEYGGVRFCSSLRQGAIFATQYHPERSAAAGLRMYQKWKWFVEAKVKGVSQ